MAANNPVLPASLGYANSRATRARTDRRDFVLAGARAGLLQCRLAAERDGARVERPALLLDSAWRAVIMHAECMVFRANNWEDVIAQAQAFLSGLSDPSNVLSISHVSESPYGVVFVWYLN